MSKIYLSLIRSDLAHPVYRELINNPPVKYINIDNKSKTKNEITVKSSLTWFYTLGKLITHSVQMPYFWYVNQDCDLIHASQHIILNKKPWVVDCEHVSGFLSSVHHPKKRSFIYKYLLKKGLESKNCKKIMPWTNAAKKSIENLLRSDKINEKIEVVYPALSIPNFKKKKTEKTTLLFVGKIFYKKGGEETLKSFEILNRRYDNIELLMICDVPEQFKRKYSSFENIKIYEPKFSREVLYEKFYSKADIFVLPTRSDTFGMVFLEAMAFELPIVTVDGFARDEIIEDGKNGFIVEGYPYKIFDENYQHSTKYGHFSLIEKHLTEKDKNKVASNLVEKLSILIEDENLMKRMGKNGKKILKEKFSIENRNKKLRRIYEEALKR